MKVVEGEKKATTVKLCLLLSRESRDTRDVYLYSVCPGALVSLVFLFPLSKYIIC